MSATTRLPWAVVEEPNLHKAQAYVTVQAQQYQRQDVPPSIGNVIELRLRSQLSQKVPADCRRKIITAEQSQQFSCAETEPEGTQANREQTFVGRQWRDYRHFGRVHDT